MSTAFGRHSRREAGQVVVLFALLLPMILAMSAAVGGIGNWYVHGKNLQTKADAGAFAGGDRWAFPCGPEIDTRIADTARLYAGSSNPQVGKVPDANVHTVLNGSDWYDDDSNPAPSEFNSPSGAVCSTMTLDVKVTEDNSFPLLSLIPLFPDIKRKARVEIQEAEALTGVLPVAIRAPEPVSAAAIYYDEGSVNKTVLGVKYLVKADGTVAPVIPGIPGGLQGWTQNNPEDIASGSNPWGAWSRFTPGAQTGVLLAVSFRGACNDSSLPPSNSKIVTTGAPCFQDEYIGQPVSSICNQGGGTQIVNCFWSTGNWPTEVQQAGLQFIQGHGTGTVPDGAAPELRGVYLDTPSANCGSYYTPLQPSSCTALLRATIDIGAFDPDGPGPLPETRSAADTEVRYRIVSDSGTYCTFSTPTCDLNGSGGPGNTSWVTTNNLPTFSSSSRRNSIAIRVRLRNTSVGGNPCGPGYSANCEWFFTAQGRTSTVPTDAQVLANPIQRSFRGNTVSAGSTRWLRLTTDADCDPFNGYDQDGPAASVVSGGAHCFYMDFGLKGGLALTSSDPVVLFNDGVGPSQMGAVDCDPAIPQGQILEDGIFSGCAPDYAKHPFDWDPLCPSANNLFMGYPGGGNPGPPWDDGRWPPLRCIKTRPTGAMNQIEKGLKLRLFGNKNANSCPTTPVGPNGYVKGRNYWDIDNNPVALGGGTYGMKEGAHDTNWPDGDPRIVTIFIAPTEAFASSGQNSYPIAGFVQIYVTGFGPMKGSTDDPCPGSTPPAEIDDCEGAACGYAMWGHLIKYEVPAPAATPSGILCNPASLQPCVPSLVE